FMIVIFTYRRFDVNVERIKSDPADSTNKSKNKAGLYALLTLCTALVLCWMSYSQWTATISSHTEDIGRSLSQYSMICTVNGLLIVLFQPFIRPLVKRWDDKLKHQLVLGLTLMSFSFFIASFAEKFTMFAVAMAILTLGEVFFTPVIPTIANKLAPPGQQGFY